MKALLLALFLIQTAATIQNQNGSLTGKVLKADGQPAAGMRVAAMAVPESHVPNGAGVLASLSETDAEGRYRLDNVPPGQYYVLAGLMDYPTFYPGATTLATARVVQVTAQTVVEGIDFTSSHPATVNVKGRLLRVPNAMLLPVTMRAALGSALRTTAKADGYFEFSQITLGTYILGAPGTAPQSLIVGDQDLYVELLPLNEAPGVNVSGRVTGSSMAAGTATAVTMSGWSGFVQLEAPLRPDGTFEFPKVPPGDYRVLPRPPIVGGAGATVQVADKDVSNVEIRLPSIVEVKGRVIAESGNLPNQTRIQFRRERGLTGMIASGANFQIQLPEEDHQVAVTLPAAYTLKSITYGGEDITQGVLKFNRSTPAKELLITVIRLPDNTVPHFKVSGRITVPGPGVRLGLVAQTGSSPPDVDVNPDGTFEFPNVDPGGYLVRISGRWLEPINENLSVINSDISGLAINVRGVAEVSGRVLVMDTAGNVLPFPQIFLLARFRHSREYSQTPVRNDGTFRMELMEGEHAVEVNNLPAGYSIKSITSGSIDLKTTPLKVAGGTSPPDIQIVIESAPH